MKGGQIICKGIQTENLIKLLYLYEDGTIKSGEGYCIKIDDGNKCRLICIFRIFKSKMEDH